jgi:hypothetical protein
MTKRRHQHFPVHNIVLTWWRCASCFDCEGRATVFVEPAVSDGGKEMLIWPLRETPLNQADVCILVMQNCFFLLILILHLHLQLVQSTL